ncbi:hypothetical protein R6Q59_018665 [Mikania micrantha]
MVDEGKIQIEKFNETDFVWWKMQNETLLSQKDLDMVLENKPKKIDAATETANGVYLTHTRESKLNDTRGLTWFGRSDLHPRAAIRLQDLLDDLVCLCLDVGLVLSQGL